MQIKNLETEKLLPYPFNNKKHGSKQIASIVESIKEFGFVQPIVVDKDNIVIIGHARLEASKAIGLPTVPVLVLDNITDHQTKRLRLLDNRLSDLGEYDLENIKLELDALGDEDLIDLFSDLDLEGGIGSSDGGDTSAKDALKERFGIPPFSILDTRQGYWIDRKRYWREIIGDNGESREETLFKESNTDVGKRITEVGTVSLLDPVLAEMMVKWFAPKGGKTFDTFAGDTVFGYVSAFLGNPFTGIELRHEQADLNNGRVQKDDLPANYICDDGQNVGKHLEPNSQDFFFSCPPYFDLEVYSDDPKDASNQESYEDFRKILENAFEGAAKALKDNRFACVVMSNIRDKRGFYIDIVGDIKAIMEKNGLHLYNDIILINSAGSAPLRANNAMKNRKVVRTHQNVMVFYKGDNGQNVSEKHGFDLMDTRQTIQFHEDVLVFYKGDPKEIQKEFPAIDVADAAGMEEAAAESLDEE